MTKLTAIDCRRPMFSWFVARIKRKEGKSESNVTYVYW